MIKILPCQAHIDVVGSLRQYDGTEREVSKGTANFFKLLMGDADLEFRDFVSEGIAWRRMPNKVIKEVGTKVVALQGLRPALGPFLRLWIRLMKNGI